MKDLDDWTEKRRRIGRAQAGDAAGFPQGVADERGAEAEVSKGKKVKVEKRGD